MIDDATHSRTDVESTRVFVLDDHPMVREALSEHLDADPELTVVGTAGDVEGALAGIAATRPAVAVLDARLSEGSGMTVCRAIRDSHPEVRCLLLTSHAEQNALLAARLAGASGYLVKELLGTGIRDGVKTVARGGTVFANEPAKSLQTQLDELVARRGVRLTCDQHRVLAGVVSGHSDDQIARSTSLSALDVRRQLDAVFADLGLGGAASVG